jgi:hypothetical protein
MRKDAKATMSPIKMMTTIIAKVKTNMLTRVHNVEIAGRTDNDTGLQ